MKKFVLLLTLALSICTGLWAYETENDLCYYFTPVRQFKIKGEIPAGKFSGHAPFGLGVDTAIYFGNQRNNLASFGMNLSLGFDAGSNIYLDDSSFDIFSFGLYGSGGGIFRFRPNRTCSFSLCTALGVHAFGATDEEKIKIGRYYRKTSTNMVGIGYTFDLKASAKFWLNRKIGLHAGVDLCFPFAGTYQVKKEGGTFSDDKYDISGGIITRIRTGVTFAVRR